MPVNREIALSILAAVGVVSLLTLIAGYLMISIAWQEFRRAQPEGGMQLSGYSLVQRALTLKCPLCGRGSISRSLFRMNEVCPSCGVIFWNGEGEWVGPVVINYAVALGAALATWAVLVMFDCSAAVQLIISSAAVIVAAFAIAPWSRSFWTLFLYLNGEVVQSKPS